MQSPWAVAALTAFMVALATVAYAGMAVLVWAQVDQACATVFIDRFTKGAGAALGFSGAAVALYGLRLWPLRLAAHRRLLLFSAAPMLLTTVFIVVAFAAVLLFNDHAR